MEKLSPEKSWNFNLNYVKDFYTKRGQVFKVDSSIFKTIFSNRIIPDYDINPNQIIYSNVNGIVISQGGSIDFFGKISNVLDFQIGLTLLTHTLRKIIKVHPLFDRKIFGKL